MPPKTHSKAKRASKGQRRWSASVKTESTYPPPGLFTRGATVIAKTLASKKVSPKGPSSGMRMLNFFINRAGRQLSQDCQKELGEAKKLLSDIIRKRKTVSPARKS